ncbi:MAG: TPM domain-containing protein [Bacteroidetes bacterium]|nr:MAG: TPM domain-containing protein [Bacteroidota bacterium]
MKFPINRRIIFWVLATFLSLSPLIGQEIPEATGFVTDTKNILAPADKARLNTYLTTLAESTSNEIAIAILDLPEGYEVAEYTGDVARKWGVGGKENNNGVVVALYPDARKMRIEVGYGLEGPIPDILTNYIMERYMKPAFQKGDYAGGLDSAVQVLAKAASGEYSMPSDIEYYSKPKARKSNDGNAVIALIVIIIAIFLLVRFFNRGGPRNGGGYDRGGWNSGLPFIFWGGGWGGGGGGSSWGGGDSGGSWGGGGGGDFGGFGGGDFGGGGSSGDW